MQINNCVFIDFLFKKRIECKALHCKKILIFYKYNMIKISLKKKAKLNFLQLPNTESRKTRKDL